MKILLSHPIGNANVREVAEGFRNKGILYFFITSLAIFENTLLFKVGKLHLFKELNRRKFDSKLKPITITSPFRDITRILATKIGLKILIRHEKGYFCNDAVCQNIDRFVANRLQQFQIDKNIDTVYAYEDGAFKTFKKAKDIGLICVYDLPIAYWETGRKLLLEEANRLPIWSKTFGGGIMDSEAKLKRKSKEIELADVIVCPSLFVYNSIPNWAKNKKIILAPFGSPKCDLPNNIPTKFQNITNRPLRVLFVGSMSQRKGLADLFQAMKLLPNSANVELVVMGSLQDTMEFYRSEYAHFIYEPGRAHNQVLELMRSCDVFCLPSIVEGRALVMQEAMSQGLPLIITPNTGGDDLIIEGETGFLVPIRSPKTIAEKILWFCNNLSELERMARRAHKHSQSYTWEKYRTTITDNLRNGL